MQLLWKKNDIDEVWRSFPDFVHVVYLTARLQTTRMKFFHVLYLRWHGQNLEKISRFCPHRLSQGLDRSDSFHFVLVVCLKHMLAIDVDKVLSRLSLKMAIYIPFTFDIKSSTSDSAYSELHCQSLISLLWSKSYVIK